MSDENLRIMFDAACAGEEVPDLPLTDEERELVESTWRECKKLEENMRNTVLQMQRQAKGETIGVIIASVALAVAVTICFAMVR